jgi:hypothetical protein
MSSVDPSRRRRSRSTPPPCRRRRHPRNPASRAGGPHRPRTDGELSRAAAGPALGLRLFDRLARYEPAETIAGFALSPLTAAAVPEITTAITHLRDVLGEATYESLARKGETMTTAAMATYAYDQIDQARTELEHTS